MLATVAPSCEKTALNLARSTIAPTELTSIRLRVLFVGSVVSTSSTRVATGG